MSGLFYFHGSSFASKKLLFRVLFTNSRQTHSTSLTREFSSEIKVGGERGCGAGLQTRKKSLKKSSDAVSDHTISRNVYKMGLNK